MKKNTKRIVNNVEGDGPKAGVGLTYWFFQELQKHNEILGQEIAAVKGYSEPYEVEHLSLSDLPPRTEAEQKAMTWDDELMS